MSIKFINDNSDDIVINESREPNQNIPVNPVNYPVSYNSRPSTLSPALQSQATNINCRMISHHVQTCPICSQLYICDRRPYAIIILIMLILLFILVKKILSI